MSADPAKTEAIKQADAPTSMSDVRSLLGMMNYVSCFTRNYADIVVNCEQWRLVKRCGPAEVLVFYGSPAFLLSWNFIVKVTLVSLAMGQPFLVIFWIVLVINSHHVANHRYDAFISQNGKHDYTLP